MSAAAAARRGSPSRPCAHAPASSSRTSARRRWPSRASTRPATTCSRSFFWEICYNPCWRVGSAWTCLWPTCPMSNVEICRSWRSADMSRASRWTAARTAWRCCAGYCGSVSGLPATCVGAAGDRHEPRCGGSQPARALRPRQARVLQDLSGLDRVLRVDL